MTINDILVKARFLQKHDTEANWLEKTDFVPGDGEIVVYDVDDNHSVPRLKIGDGVNAINDLPFISDEIFNQIAALRDEITDARLDFEGQNHETLGEAIRAQGTKIKLAPNTAIGENALVDAEWNRAFATDVAVENGTLTLTHNENYGYYEDQITESSITPHVGYYLNGDMETLQDEVPEEAIYLTDAASDKAANVKGSATWEPSADMIAAAVLDLAKPAMLSAVELTCRPYDNALVEFDIEVKNEAGKWQTVKKVVEADQVFRNKTYENEEGEWVTTVDSTVKFSFDPIIGSSVRVLVYKDSDDECPQILEAVLYEIKLGTPVKKIIPVSVETDTQMGGGSPVACVIDGDKNTNYQTFNFFPSSITFNFEPNTTISRFKLPAYSTTTATPKKIILEALIDGEWVDIFGSAQPNAETGKKYTSVQIYDVGLTDTFVLDFDTPYTVDAIRMYASSAIQGNLQIINEVEFYGPAESMAKATSLTTVCGSEIESEGDIWYLGFNANCEKFDENSRPQLIVEADINGERKKLYSSIAYANGLEDYYCTFKARGIISNLTITVDYFNNQFLQNKTCELSNITLVNLTAAYGEDTEPTAETYHKALTAPQMSILNQEGLIEYALTDGMRGNPGKTAYEFAAEGGFTGTEAEFIEKIAKPTIEIEPYKQTENLLKDVTWNTLPESQIVANEDGVMTVIHNGYYGEYLEQIKESTLTPHVGYTYRYGDYDDVIFEEVPEEAKYLTDAMFSSAAYVHGITPLGEISTDWVPCAVIDLAKPTHIGAVEITCRMDSGVGKDYPTDYEVEVLTSTGYWEQVGYPHYGDFTGDRGTVRHEFDPVFGSKVRIRVYDYEGKRPAFLEVGVYEVKTGKVLKKVQPIDITSTAVPATGEAVDVIIDEGKHSAFQTYTSGPVFNFKLADDADDPVTISRLKIAAWNNQTNAPKNIIVDIRTKDRWINVYGKAPCYAVGLKDTFILDFDKDYDAYELRLKVTSPIGSNVIILNDVEIFGPPTEPENLEDHVGIVYNTYDERLVQKEGDIWYLSAKVACEDYNQALRPDVVLSMNIVGKNNTVATEYPKGTNLNDYYATFQVPSNYGRPITDIKVAAKYHDSFSTCKTKITDMVLVNLTDLYGAGNEPSAADYYANCNSLKLTVHTPNGPERYNIGKDVGGVRAINNMTGDVSFKAVQYDVNQNLETWEQDTARSNIAAAPGGYGWGEQYAKSYSYYNLNNLTTTGVYSVYCPSYGPESNSYKYWTVIVFAKDNSNRQQIACDGFNVYQRYRESGSWSSWVKISAAVSYHHSQGLTDAQKSTARSNIGAAPSGYGWGDTYFTYPTTNNLNDISTTSVYATTSSTSNIPNAYCKVVITYTIDTNNQAQIAYCSDGKMFIRFKKSATWDKEWTAYSPFSVTYVNQSLTTDQQSTARANIGAAAQTDVNSLSNKFSNGDLILTDRITGENYTLYVENGELTIEKREV